MKAGVVVFPGSNCDRDVKTALETVGFEAEYLWHKDSEISKNLDLIVLPGGFSYGDYLRCGAISAHSKIISEVKKFADKGGKVLGICNGFQVLSESQLVPGVLIRNKNLKFICKDVYLKAINTEGNFTKKYKPYNAIKLSVAHHDGNFFIDDEGLKAINDNDQIAFKYCNAEGAINPEDNPNGSIENIAGVYNKNQNVLGLMPHPERHCDLLTGGIAGKAIFEGLLG